MLRRHRNVSLGAGVRLGRHVVFDVADGARVTLGEGVILGEGCRFHVASGEVVVGAGTSLGERCVISAHERVEIGARCRLGDGVVLVDFDHVFADPERPIREQGLATAPVRIGDEVVVDHGASVLRGVTVGDGARVTEHAVVTHDVPGGVTVGGVPARANAPIAPS